MKTYFFLCGFLFFTLATYAQKKAVTETGEEVILYDDGTWKYANDSTKEEVTISTNSKIFKKSTNATFLVKSIKSNTGIWINTKKWSFKKGVSNEDAEYEFELKDKDLYGMMITERIEIPLEALKKAALENAKTAAPDIKIIKQEYRNVNDKKILMLQMNGTADGIKFSYFGYYFSNAKGTVQLVTYTSQGLFNEMMNEAEELLNGLVTVE